MAKSLAEGTAATGASVWVLNDGSLRRLSAWPDAGELEKRGIPMVHKIYPGAPHGFLNMRHKQTPALKQDILEFLAESLSTTLQSWHQKLQIYMLVALIM